METSLGAAIDTFLHTHRLTQTWLAEQTGVSSSYINSLVKGGGTLSVKMAYSIGAAFDSVTAVSKPWRELLMTASLNDTAHSKNAELAEYTKQQEKTQWDK